MTIQIKHAYTSLKSDGVDATFVQPSHWNSDHSTSVASGMLIGRLSVGAGTFEEIPISAFMASLLSSANYAALAAKLGLFSPGDVKFSVNGSLGAAGGWLVYDGAATLGNTGATAATFHDVSFYELYKAIYNNISNTYCPVAGGRTSIDADWAANKAITLPLFNGRALIGAGTGVGLTARPAGQSGGVESVTLGLGNMPYHQHAVYIGEPVGGHSHALGDYAASGQAGNDNGATVGIWYNPSWNVTVPISKPSLAGVYIGSAPNTNNSLTAFAGGSAGAAVPFVSISPFVAMWVHLKI